MPTPTLRGLRKKLGAWRDTRLIERSGVFDRAWYLRRYPDVAAAHVDPLRHYVDCGFAEGRFPNPIFHSKWYSTQYLSGIDRNPLVDYLRRGVSRGRRPNRWFDPTWYRRRYGLPSVDPMRHYLNIGAREGFETAPDFPLADFARRYPDIGGHGSALGSFLHDYRMVGGVDGCTSYYVRGWTSRRHGPSMVVTVLVNGEPQGEVTPWFERPDVQRVKGIAALGFFFAFPRRLARGDVVAFADEFGDVLLGCTTTYEIPPLGSSKDHYPSRAAIAEAFLRGRGLEIGAFTQPTDLPPDRDIVFFDRYATEDLRRFYDRDCGRPMMEPTYVGEAEGLDGVPEASFDFIIANHVIEHLLDPIRFLKNLADRLVDGGRAMIAAPDKRYCFDAERELTPFSHLVEDHERGGARSQFEHFLERARLEGLAGEAALAFAGAIDKTTIHFHYHVWDADSFVAFIKAAIDAFALPLVLLHHESTTYDVIVLLEKRRQDTPSCLLAVATPGVQG